MFACIYLTGVHYYTCSQQFGIGKSLHLAFCSALEKKLNRVPWNPSVCMQQPCTSVWMTLLTKTRLMDLDEELNKEQYKSKRSKDHKHKQKWGFSRQDGITISDNSNNNVQMRVVLMNFAPIVV